MALLVPRDPQVSVLLLVKIHCFCGKESAVHLCVHAQVYMCVRPFQRWDTHLMFSSGGQALWVPKDSEVKWDSLVSKVSRGRGRESKDSVETSRSRGKLGFRAQRHLMDTTHKLRSARGEGETKMDGKLSSVSH